MSDDLPTSYADSRTGRGDKWFQQIRDLRSQANGLDEYSDSHDAFVAMIADAFKALPMNQAREIARKELMEFCVTRKAAAQDLRLKLLSQAAELENNGVPE